MFLFKKLIFNSKMHQIAQVCTYICKNFPGVILWTPKTGERISPIPFPLSTCPSSHSFRASAAAACQLLSVRSAFSLPVCIKKWKWKRLIQSDWLTGSQTECRNGKNGHRNARKLSGKWVDTLRHMSIHMKENVLTRFFMLSKQINICTYNIHIYNLLFKV